jgi:hypothetical protein
MTGVIITLFSGVKAQEVKYKAGYFGFFDNREYFNPYVNDQTIFGSRIYGEIGASLNVHNKIMAGANFLYEFGSKGELTAPDLTLYYNGTRKNIDFYLGAFPRLNLLNMPMALMIDTFQYYRPNIEGILINYKSNSFRQNIWIDWTGHQSDKTREMFMLGFSGYAHKGILTYQHHFIMNHIAHDATHNPEQHLRDNGGYSLLAGADLTSFTGLDTLAFSAGILGSYDRIRSEYDFIFPFGWLAEAEARYKGFGIHGTLYSGDSQVILSGDGFYKSTFYTRADAYYQVSTSHIEGKLQFSAHFLPDVTDLSMSLLIRAQLDGIIRRQK